MSQDVARTELQDQTRQLMDGPLKHIRVAALAAALVPLASVFATPASAQQPPPCATASGGVICGTVFNDTNGNGIQNNGETGAPTVTVQIVCSGTGCNPSDTTTALTDENGNFFSAGLDDSDTAIYTVTVLPPPGEQASPSATTVQAVGSETDFGLTPAAPPSTCVAGAANSTLINNFGVAGPNNFTVLSLGGLGSVININMASIEGNVGLPNTGTLQESAPSSVSGDLIVGSLTNTNGVRGQHGSIVVNDSLLAQAVNAAENTANSFAMLPSTPAVQAQFPANGQITGNLTVTGTVGMNVVNLSNFTLDNKSGSLTLTGPAGTAFIINDFGNFNLHTGNIRVSGGVGPLDVVYNIINPKAMVTTMVPTTAVGILLAPDNAISSMDSATYTGEVIGGYQKTLLFMSGSKVRNPCGQQ